MNEFDLPSPGIGGKGHHLRRIMAQAISYIEVNGPAYTNGVHPQITEFQAFLTAAQAAMTAAALQIPVMTFTPALKSYSIASGATAGPTLAKGGSAGAVTYSSSDTSVATVNSATGVVTGVKIGTCTITVAMAANGVYRAQSLSYPATVTA